MGKTCLARNFLDATRARGIRVYEGRCHEAESLPFKGLDGLVDMLCEELMARDESDVAALLPPDIDALTRMFPVLKRIDWFCSTRPPRHAKSPQEMRSAAFDALRYLFTRLADDAPLVLFLDDVQWAEEDSLELLAALLRQPGPNMLVVATARRQEQGLSAGLERFMAEVGAMGHVASTEIALAGLDESSIHSLVESHGASSLDAEQLFQESGGIPSCSRACCRAEPPPWPGTSPRSWCTNSPR